MEAVDAAAPFLGNLTPPVRQEPQNPGVILGDDLAQLGALLGDTSDAGRVDGVGLASVADVEQTCLGRQGARHVDDVAISGTSLTEVFGISDVLAAKILGQAGDVTRFKSADHFASYTGTAPIEASSGPIVRHRLSRAGNRQLNHALHLAARVQAVHPNPGQTYYQRKLAEAKTRQEALRCLKRQIAKTVYRVLLADHQRLRIVGD